MSSITTTPSAAQTVRLSTGSSSCWEHFKHILTHTHTYSRKGDRGKAQPPRSYIMMAQWAEQLGIDAIGMGSPYTPASAENYFRYNQQHRELYYDDPSFDHASVRDDDEIARMLEQANAVSRGRTLFYLDNETPKGRYGHLWWIGYHLDYPAWHDYDVHWNQWMCNVMAPGDDGDEPVPYTRRPYRQIVATQRRAGALGFWAHPTSWWWDGDGRFITNIASEMPAHAVADGYLDGLVIMGYRAWRPEYMNLWFALLDAGYRVTGVAEEDVGLSNEKVWQRTNAMTNHVHIPGALTVPAMTKAFASGHLAASNGPSLDMTVDDQPMGSAAITSPGALHRVTIRIDPQGSRGALDLIGRGGKPIWQQDVNEPATIELTIPGGTQRGYLVARYVAEGESRHRAAAVGNPVYLHPEGEGFAQPARTQLTLTIESGSPFAGGRVQFEQADGAIIEQGRLPAGTLKRDLPAGGRFTLIKPSGQARTEYLINANDRVTALQRYLYRGRFLRDFPSLGIGQVPAAAWRLDEFAAAMQSITLIR